MKSTLRNSKSIFRLLCRRWIQTCCDHFMVSVICLFDRALDYARCQRQFIKPAVHARVIFYPRPHSHASHGNQAREFSTAGGPRFSQMKEGWRPNHWEGNPNVPVTDQNSMVSSKSVFIGVHLRFICSLSESVISSLIALPCFLVPQYCQTGFHPPSSRGPDFRAKNHPLHPLKPWPR